MTKAQANKVARNWIQMAIGRSLADWESGDFDGLSETELNKITIEVNQIQQALTKKVGYLNGSSMKEMLENIKK